MRIILFLIVIHQWQSLIMIKQAQSLVAHHLHYLVKKIRFCLKRLKTRLLSHRVIDSVFGFSYMIFSFEFQVTVVAGQDVGSVNRLNVLVEAGWTRKTLATLPAYPTSINNSMFTVLSNRKKLHD